MEDYVAMLKSDLQKGTSTLAIIKHGSLNGWFPPTWPENTPPKKSLQAKVFPRPACKLFQIHGSKFKFLPLRNASQASHVGIAHIRKPTVWI